MRAGQTQHLYFLVHRSHERFKVGVALRPVVRWAQIQSHHETDFTESMVFDIDAGVSAAWVERTLHRALVESHLDMPRDSDGHSEWFDYAALPTARAFSLEHRILLGIGEGYAAEAPSARAAVLAGPDRVGSRGRIVSTPLDLARLNRVTAEVIEERIDRWVSSGALISSSVGEHGLHLYFDRALISVEDFGTPTPWVAYRGAGVVGVFGGCSEVGGYIRQTVCNPFGGEESLLTLPFPHVAAGQVESWESVAPGSERIRQSIYQLHSSLPSIDMTDVDGQIESFRRSFWEFVRNPSAVFE